LASPPTIDLLIDTTKEKTCKTFHVDVGQSEMLLVLMIDARNCIPYFLLHR